MRYTLGGLAAENDFLLAAPIHIPDGNGGSYKTELALFRSAERTEKIIWWHADDPRPEPHNHPWDFQSTILNGGYTEHRWWQEDGIWNSETKIYRAGDVNVVKANVFHVVVNVLPQTITHLICGKASENNLWGYLNLDDLTYIPAKKEVSFVEDLKKLNPHLR